ncbi:hypothetical protein ACH5RR_010840 [Cinchona calisaya]|uniref:DUF3511 domain-containing protein n=1 Tax=Cinchona calisaya TaxID=153742 RepID=A0ABD3AK45_9GENT
MEEYRPSFGGPIGERRLDIVSGKGFGANQVYTTTIRTRSPDLPTYDQVASSKPWGCRGDSEMKRRKRIAKYKVYSIEGRVKASIKNGLRWFKNKCSELIHG